MHTRVRRVRGKNNQSIELWKDTAEAGKPTDRLTWISHPVEGIVFVHNNQRQSEDKEGEEATRYQGVCWVCKEPSPSTVSFHWFRKPAKQRKFKDSLLRIPTYCTRWLWTPWSGLIDCLFQVFDLRSTCFSFGLPLAWTCACDNLRWLWSSSNSYEIRHKFFIVWTQVDRKSAVYGWNLWLFATCMHKFASRLASTIGHPSQVRTQVLLLQMLALTQCIHFASPFGQGFTVDDTWPWEKKWRFGEKFAKDNSVLQPTCGGWTSLAFETFAWH